MEANLKNLARSDVTHVIVSDVDDGELHHIIFKYHDSVAIMCDSADILDTRFTVLTMYNSSGAYLALVQLEDCEELYTQDEADDFYEGANAQDTQEVMLKRDMTKRKGSTDRVLCVDEHTLLAHVASLPDMVMSVGNHSSNSGMIRSMLTEGLLSLVAAQGDYSLVAMTDAGIEAIRRANARIIQAR